MTQHHHELEELARNHPVTQEEKIKRHAGRLQRMLNFYTNKLDEAPPKQAVMFEAFVSSLGYAISVINQYRNITLKLSELVEGDENENRPDSES